MRPGRLDRKIEIPLPNEHARMEILKIHATHITKHGDIDYEAIVKLADNFNGADLRNVCTEAGMFAIRDERDYIVQVGAALFPPKPSGLRAQEIFACGISAGEWCCSVRAEPALFKFKVQLTSLKRRGLAAVQ